MRIPASPREVVRAITALHPLIDDEGSHWFWNGTHWALLRGSPLAWFLNHLQHHDVFIKDADGVEKNVDTSQLKFTAQLDSYIRCSPEIIRPDYFLDAPRGLTVCNGFLHFDDDGHATLLSHDPGHRSRYFLEAAYDPVADCPYTLEILGSYFTHDRDNDGAAKQRAILEFLALCLFGQATANRRGALLWITGSKGSGKSTLIENMVGAAFDTRMVAAVEPHKFANPNELVKLVGCVINFKDEIESRALQDVGTMKAVLSGAQISVKKLYRDLATARITCGHLFVSNDMPIMADSSGALHDRVVHVHFTHPFDRPFEPAPRIAAKMQTERAGILNLLCRVYREMLERGGGVPKLTVPQSARNYQHAAALEADALRSFIHDCCTYDEKCRVTPAEVLQCFTQWRNHVGITYKLQVTAMALGRKVLEVIPECRGEPDHSRPNTFFRLRLKDPTFLLTSGDSDE